MKCQIYILVNFFVFISGQRTESSKSFGYNAGPGHGCRSLGRKINVYNYYCKGGGGGYYGDEPQNNRPIQADVPVQANPINPVYVRPFNPILNLFRPFRRFVTPVTYPNRPVTPVRIGVPQSNFAFIDQGSSVAQLTPNTQYRPGTANTANTPVDNRYKPENDEYNPFRPESPTNVKPTAPSGNRPSSGSSENGYNPYQPENNYRPPTSPTYRPTSNNTPSPSVVDYYGTPVPTIKPTSSPNYAVPAYPIKLPEIEPLSPSGASSYHTNSGNRPVSQASSTSYGYRPINSGSGSGSNGYQPSYSSASAHNPGNGPGYVSISGNRPGSASASISNGYGTTSISSNSDDYKPISEDYNEEVPRPLYRPFGVNQVGGITQQVNGFIQNFSGQTLIPGRSFWRNLFGF